MPDDPRDQLANIGRRFYDRGWMWGTAGNLSARNPDGTLWVTASGVPKGALTREHFVRVTLAGELVESAPGYRASAETTLHLAIYGWDYLQRACLHVHTVPSNLVTRMAPGDLRLPPIEMIKGLGVWDADPKVTVPVFENKAHVPDIADEVTARFNADPPDVPVFLIRDHGITVWGRTLDEAVNRVEVAVYLFDWMVQAKAVGVTW